MQECCPLLLEVLSTSLGTMDAPEIKIATLATICGMLIYSRDPPASGIQRMYSTLTIRYHADNKVLNKTRKNLCITYICFFLTVYIITKIKNFKVT